MLDVSKEVDEMHQIIIKQYVFSFVNFIGSLFVIKGFRPCSTLILKMFPDSVIVKKIFL